MTGWRKERCAERPDELQLIAPGLYMERKNIREVLREGNGMEEPYTDYECECREITVSEYEMVKSLENANTEKAVSAAIDEYTLQLMEEGVL